MQEEEKDSTVSSTFLVFSPLHPGQLHKHHQKFKKKKIKGITKNGLHRSQTSKSKEISPTSSRWSTVLSSEHCRKHVISRYDRIDLHSTLRSKWHSGNHRKLTHQQSHRKPTAAPTAKKNAASKKTLPMKSIFDTVRYEPSRS